MVDNVWGTDMSLIDEDEFCPYCEREIPFHYQNCPTRRRMTMPKHVALRSDDLTAAQFNDWKESLALQAVYNGNHWRVIDDMRCPVDGDHAYISTKPRWYSMGRHAHNPVHAFCAGCGVVFNRMQPLAWR